MQVHAHGKSYVKGITGRESLGLQALRPSPADGFIVETGSSIGQFLVHPQLDVVFLDHPGRQKQAYAVAGEYRLRVAMAKGLQPAEIFKQLGSDGGERNLGID